MQKTKTDGLSGCVGVNSLSFLLMQNGWNEHSGPGSCDDAKWKLLQTEREEKRGRITSVSKLQFQQFLHQETFSLYQLFISKNAKIFTQHFL